MKKIFIILLSAVVLFFGVYFIGSGFTLRKDVVIYDFSVSDDGSFINIKAGVSSSAGYIRAVKNVSDNEEIKDLQFYSAFGGINGKTGSRESFDIPITDKVREIYIGGQLILYKNEDTGLWERV